MGLFDRLAEQRIQDAIADGAFDALPGHGAPLELEDLSRVPEDLRTSYVLLKGANVLPEELQARKETLRLEDLLAACHDDEECRALRSRRDAAALRYRLLMERRRLSGSAQTAHRDYAGALGRRFARPR